MSDSRKYEAIFEYLSAETLPEGSEPAVVFGRNDYRVGWAAGELVIANLAEVVVITGGVGKDTEDLLDRGYSSEAGYLQEVTIDYLLSRSSKLPEFLLDEKACHGGENARFSLAMLAEADFAIDSLTAVAHATSARRLAETLRFEADKRTGTNQETTMVHVKASKYLFEADSPIDQKEASKELLRLADWPSAGLLHDQPDLDPELVEFARAKHPGTPYPPSRLKTAVLRRLPPPMRLEAIKMMS